MNNGVMVIVEGDRGHAALVSVCPLRQERGYIIHLMAHKNAAQMPGLIAEEYFSLLYFNTYPPIICFLCSYSKSVYMALNIYIQLCQCFFLFYGTFNDLSD